MYLLISFIYFKLLVTTIYIYFDFNKIKMNCIFEYYLAFSNFVFSSNSKYNIAHYVDLLENNSFSIIDLIEEISSFDDAVSFLFYIKISIIKYFLLIIIIVLAVFSITHVYRKGFSKYYTLVYSSDNKLFELLKKLEYFPSMFLPFSLLQMAFFEFQKPIQTNYRREYIRTNNNITISIDWVINYICSHSYSENHNTYNKASNNKRTSSLNKSSNHKKEFILLIHGVTGGSETRYMKTIVKLLESQFNLAIVHYRGVNDTPLSTNKGFDAGITEDTEFIINYFINHKYIKLNQVNKDINDDNNNKNSFIIISFSMGAMLTTKVLSQLPEYYKQFIKSFISISNPLLLKPISDKNQGKLIEFFMLLRYKYIFMKHEILRSNEDIDFYKILSKQTNTCNKYDEEYTLKINKGKYTDIFDYYNRVSCGEDLIKLSVPSLFINSYKDPLNSIECINCQEMSLKNKNLNFIVTSDGGHVIWSEGILKPKRVS